MFINLEYEMKKAGITSNHLQKLLHLSKKTINNRMNGKNDWYYDEAKKIRDTFFPYVSLEYLFNSSIENKFKNNE